MGPSGLWPVSDVHCKIQTRPLVREGALHEEASTCQTKEHVKSGHGPQGAARHQDRLNDWPSVANSTALHSIQLTLSLDATRRRRPYDRPNDSAPEFGAYQFDLGRGTENLTEIFPNFLSHLRQIQ
jgi:hypothetical protein